MFDHRLSGEHFSGNIALVHVPLPSETHMAPSLLDEFSPHPNPHTSRVPRLDASSLLEVWRASVSQVTCVAYLHDLQIYAHASVPPTLRGPSRICSPTEKLPPNGRCSRTSSSSSRSENSHPPPSLVDEQAFVASYASPTAWGLRPGP